MNKKIIAAIAIATAVSAQAGSLQAAPAGFLNIHNDTGSTLLFKCPFMSPITVPNGADGKKLYWAKGVLSLLPYNTAIKCEFFDGNNNDKGSASMTRSDAGDYSVTLLQKDASTPFPYAVSYEGKAFAVNQPFALSTNDNVTVEVATQ